MQIPTQSQEGARESALLSRFQIRTTLLNAHLHALFTTPYEADTYSVPHDTQC